MADYPGQAHQQQHLSHHQQQQQQHYEQQMRQQQQQQQYTLQQQQHSMAAMQHAQSQHMQQIMQQQQQHQQSPQMLAHPMNTTNTSPPNMGQRPSGLQMQQQHNNLLHQQVQQQSRQISNSPQHMLQQQQQQASHLTPPSPAHRQQQTPPNSQQQQQQQHVVVQHQQQQQYNQQGNPGQMMRQPQYIQFARPGTSAYSNQAAGVSNATNVLHQPQYLPKQLQKPGGTVVTVHSQQPGLSTMQPGPQRVLTQQPIQYRPQQMGRSQQPVRYAYIQSDGSVQPISQDSDRPVQIVSQLHPMQLQYQQAPPIGQQSQGSALRQALVQDARHPNSMLPQQQRPVAQTSLSNMAPHNVVLVSANGQQQALNSVVVSGSPSISNAVYIDGSSLDSSSANNVQADSPGGSSPPDSNSNHLSKPSITTRNRPKSKSPSKMGMAGPSMKPMPPGVKPVFGKPIVGRVNGGKPAMSNGNPSLPGYSSAAKNGLIYGKSANLASKVLMTKRELDKLVKNVDGYTTLEDDVSEAVLLLLDDFVDEVIQGSTALSQHRGSKKLETKDVRYFLKHKFDMALPPDTKTPLGEEDGTQSGKAVGPPNKRPALAIHQQRLALIDKSLKKL